MLTPGDIANKVFEKKMGGYRVQDVDGFMTEVNLTVSQLNREIAELKKRCDAAEKKLAGYETEHENISQALLSAQKLADSIVRDAQAKAEITMRDAEIKAGRIKEKVKDAILEQQDEFTKTKSEVADFRKKILGLYKAQVELIMKTPGDDEEPAEKESPAAAPAEEAERVPEESAEPEKAPDAQAEAAEDTAPQPETPAPAEPEPEATEEEAKTPEDGGKPESTTAFKLNLKFDEARGEYLPASDEGLKKMSKRFGDPDSVEDDFSADQSSTFRWKRPKQ